MRSDGMRVVVVMAIAITLEVLMSLFAVQRDYAGLPLTPLIHPTVTLTILALGAVAVILMLGPKHLKTWLIAILFIAVTFVGSFIVGEFVISRYTYKRDFTFRSFEAQSKPLREWL